jgi:glycosyltransferase involved in cell wall biosynthesis
MTGPANPEAGAARPGPDVSLVMPCLNEAETIAGCITRAQDAFKAHGIDGEIVVADNGSTDDSAAIATGLGARVVPVPEKGYGHALAGGIAAAAGRYVMMGDADGQHDFADIPRFLGKIREGYELVQGCRLPAGGGRIMPGGMAWSHRVIGNPMFSLLARWWFGAPVHDVYCGMRMFERELFPQLSLRCSGMEFSTEMILKASLMKVRISEVPIDVHPAGRTVHAAHMRTVKDGWRTLRFFLLFSPRWLFLIPGLLAMTAGAAGFVLALTNIFAAARHPQLLPIAGLALLVGYQVALFAVFSKTFAVNEGILPQDPRLDRFYGVVDIEKGMVLGILGVVAGLWLLWAGINVDSRASWVLTGATVAALGVQTVFSSFMVSMLGLKRR